MKPEAVKVVTHPLDALGTAVLSGLFAMMLALASIGLMLHFH